MTKRIPFLATICIVVSLAQLQTAQAEFKVGAGFDLFQSTSGTTFNTIPFEGVPLGFFDFGSGLVSTGLTDTIVERKSDAVGISGSSETIDIELVALQLKSVAPVDLGADGFHDLFITLDPGTISDPTPSQGSMTIEFTETDMSGGKFSSTIGVNFLVRLDSLVGTVIDGGSVELTSTDVWWGRESTGFLIDGVNHLLNTTDSAIDFFPSHEFTESHPNGTNHVVRPTPEPEPASVVVWSLLAAAGGLVAWRRRKK